MATCDNPTAHDGWTVFRQEGLWPPEGDRGFKCTGKKKALALANSQMDCQLVAESRSHMHYQYHSKLSKCATSAHCRNPIHGGNWRVFSKPPEHDHEHDHEPLTKTFSRALGTTVWDGDPPAPLVAATDQQAVGILAAGGLVGLGEGLIAGAVGQSFEIRDSRVEAPAEDGLKASLKFASMLGISSLVPHVEAHGSVIATVEKAGNDAFFRSLIKAWPVDDTSRFSNRQTAESFLFDTPLFPDPVVPPFEMDTPEGLAWLLTRSAGALMLTDCGDHKFCFDTSETLADVEMKAGYPSLVLKVVGVLDVDTDQPFTIESIEYDGHSYASGESGFSDVCRMAGTAVLTLASINNHLLYSHLLTTGGITAASQVHLPAKHPLRRLLAMGEFDNLQGSETGFQNLVAESTSFDKFFGMSHVGMRAVLQKAAYAYNMKTAMTMPGILQQMGLGIEDDLGWNPALADLLSWWQLWTLHAEEYVDIFYDDTTIEGDAQIGKWFQHVGGTLEGSTSANTPSLAEIVEISASYLFVSTAYHELVGAQTYKLAANPYVISSVWRRAVPRPLDCANLQLDPCEELADAVVLEDRIASPSIARLSRTLAFATTKVSPKLRQSWTHMAIGMDAAESSILAANSIFDGLEDKMLTLENEMSERNKDRFMPFLTLMPDELECSCGV